MEKSKDKCNTPQPPQKTQKTCDDSSSHIAMLEQIPIPDVIKFLEKRFSEDFLFQIATDIKLKEIEKDMIGAFQVSFHYLHVNDSQQSFTANLIVVGDKIIGQNRLTGYAVLKKVTLSKGELIVIDQTSCYHQFNIPLIDSYITMYDSGKHQITITVHKMLTKKSFC